ncbi:MAG: na+/Pi-cotransporter family protein [Zetaproteobacteria bacterium]|nr:MAG: na+/Pi-cotransporter family protein [Zetaproteobacteria bacterium]
MPDTIITEIINTPLIETIAPEAIQTSVTLTLLKIIGAVSLLLWGTRMIKLGFTRAYATSLQRIIATNTNSRIKAFLAGLGVTAILQSSTATAMICASFASKKMIGTAAGLAVIIGADVSTTLVAQVLTFDLSWLMPVFIFTGVALHHRYEHSGRKKHIARALIGLGLVLLSLSIIKESALPLGESETLPLILKPLENEPLLALLIAGLMTWMLHSSLAAVLIIASFTSSGLINMHLGFLLVLGANLGGAIIPYAMTFKMDARARRITTGNLIMRISCIILILPFLGILINTFSSIEIAASREIIHFHTIFNVLLACIFLPFIPTLSKLCKNLVPYVPTQIDEKEKPLYLDETALSSPTIALAGAARETLRIAKIVEDMFTDSMAALKDEDISITERIKESDDIVDKLHNSIKLYLTRVNQEALDPKESDRFVQILSFSTNIEHIGDIIDNSLVDLVLLKINKKNRFSKAGFKEIQEFHKTILTNMKIAQAIFMSEDPILARQLVEGKKMVRKAAMKSSERHFQRLREGIPETLSTSALHTDIIRDYRRINSYVTTIAYAILENAETHNRAHKDESLD